MKKKERENNKGLFSKTNDNIKKNFPVYLVSGIAILLSLFLLLQIGIIEEQTEKKYRDYINTFCLKNKEPGLDLINQLNLSNLSYEPIPLPINYDYKSKQEGETI